MEQYTIQYNYFKISEGQFATFEENFDVTAEVTMNNEVAFGYDFNNNVLACNETINYTQSGKPVVKLCLSSYFAINPETIEKLKSGNGILFPKEVLWQFASLNYGAMRGVMFEKLKDTVLKDIVLPPFYFDKLITEDLVIKG